MRRDARRLKLIEIPEPCTVPWDGMVGNELVRLCGQCDNNVYNVAGFTAREAMILINASENRSCLQLYRRLDGTVVTASCWSRLKVARRHGPIAVALVLFLAFVGLFRVLATVRWARYLADRLEAPRVTAGAPVVLAPAPPSPVWGVVAPRPPTLPLGGVPPISVEQRQWDERTDEEAMERLHRRALRLRAIGDCEGARKLVAVIANTNPDYHRRKVAGDARLMKLSCR